ncbi:MAG: DUF3261 domain-containing protein [Agarilytica sp.]
MLARIRHFTLAFLALYFLLTLSACQHLAPAQTHSLYPSIAQQDGLAVFQQVAIQHKSKYYRYDTAIEFKNDIMHMKLLSELGRELAWVKISNGKVLDRKNNTFLDKAPIEKILNGLQSAFWPLASLEKHLPPNLSITQKGNKRQRFVDGHLESYSVYDTKCAWNGELRFYDLEHNYKVHFKSVILSQTHPFALHESQCPPH